MSKFMLLKNITFSFICVQSGNCWLTFIKFRIVIHAAKTVRISISYTYSHDFLTTKPLWFGEFMTETDKFLRGLFSMFSLNQKT